MHCRPVDRPPQAAAARPRLRPLVRLRGRRGLRDRRDDGGACQAGAAQEARLRSGSRLQARQERRHHQEHAQLPERRVSERCARRYLLVSLGCSAYDPSVVLGMII